MDEVGRGGHHNQSWADRYLAPPAVRGVVERLAYASLLCTHSAALLALGLSTSSARSWVRGVALLSDGLDLASVAFLQAAVFYWLRKHSPGLLEEAEKEQLNLTETTKKLSQRLYSDFIPIPSTADRPFFALSLKLIKIQAGLLLTLPPFALLTRIGYQMPFDLSFLSRRTLAVGISALLLCDELHAAEKRHPTALTIRLCFLTLNITAHPWIAFRGCALLNHLSGVGGYGGRWSQLPPI